MSETEVRYFKDQIVFAPTEAVHGLLRENRKKNYERGVISYELQHPDKSPITSMKRLFDAVHHSLPKAHEVNNNWDALSDVIWQGFSNLDYEFVDIVWNDADVVADIYLPTLVRGTRFIFNSLDGVQKKYGANHDLFFRIILAWGSNNHFVEGLMASWK